MEINEIQVPTPLTNIVCVLNLPENAVDTLISTLKCNVQKFSTPLLKFSQPVATARIIYVQKCPNLARMFTEPRERMRQISSRLLTPGIFVPTDPKTMGPNSTLGAVGVAT